jgi:hypothetical protein
VTPAEYQTLSWLHVHAQYLSHCEARIFGSREALLALRDCIDRALADKNGAASMEAMAGDGEGYAVEIRRLPPSAIRNARLPYTASCCTGERE